MADTWLIGALGTDASATAGAQQPFKVDPRPVVDVAVMAAVGTTMMHRPIGAVRLSNGGLVVTDAHGGAVHFLDSTGHELRSVGKSGVGQGNFQHLSWMMQCGVDSVFVWDNMRQRMTVITDMGRVSTEYSLGFAETGPFEVDAVACSRDGVFAFEILRSHRRAIAPGAPEMTAQGLGNRGDQVVRGEGLLALGDSHGRIGPALGPIPASEQFQCCGGTGLRPLGKRTSLVVSRDRLFVGTGDSALVEVFGLDATRLSSFALEIPDRRPTRANYEQAVDEVVASVPAGKIEAVREHMLRAPMPGRLPPYTALIADTDALLWIQLSSPGDASTAIRAVDNEGKVRGEVRIPGSIRVTEIGHDYILGLYVATDGGSHLALYRLHR